MRNSSLTSAIRLLATACLLLSACNAETFSRHKVSGKVSYRGQPVQYGMLVFEPKESIGKIAPVCYAPVRNGAYETTTTEGPTTGAYKVRVIGFDRSKLKADEVVEDIPELFPEYVLNVEIPPPEGLLDVEVPAGPARKSNR